MKTRYIAAAVCLLFGSTGCRMLQTTPRTAVYNTRVVYAETEFPIIAVLAGGCAQLEAEVQKSLALEDRDLFAEEPAEHTSRVQQLYRVQTPLVRAAARRLLSHGYTAVVPCNLDGNVPAGQWVDVTEQMIHMVELLAEENANNLLDSYLPKAGDGLRKNGQQ